MFSIILIPVDGSEHANTALKAGADLGIHQRSRVIELHVMEETGSSRTPEGLARLEHAEHLHITDTGVLMAVGRSIVDAAAARFRELGVEQVEKRVTLGNPRRQIVRRAGEKGADLIVMGRRGPGLLADLLPGSVSHDELAKKSSHHERRCGSSFPAATWEMRSPSLTMPNNPSRSSTTGTALTRDSSSSVAISWTSVSGDTVMTGLVMTSFAFIVLYLPAVAGAGAAQRNRPPGIGIPHESQDRTRDGETDAGQVSRGTETHSRKSGGQSRPPGPQRCSVRCPRRGPRRCVWRHSAPAPSLFPRCPVMVPCTMFESVFSAKWAFPSLDMVHVPPCVRCCRGNWAWRSRGPCPHQGRSDVAPKQQPIRRPSGAAGSTAENRGQQAIAEPARPRTCHIGHTRLVRVLRNLTQRNAVDITHPQKPGVSIAMTRARTAVLGITLVVLGGCVYLPRFDQAVPTRAIPPNSQSRIANLLGPEFSSFSRTLLLEKPALALRSWLHLAATAETSIDLQYFIVQNDATALLFLERLLQAADRGVRVRMLLDDISISGLVDRLHALDEHPNVEIRIFNPFNIRVRSVFSFFRIAEIAVDGNRLNHRMHNKLFVADNQVAILGGRNIGDDYFGRGEERNFVDTDILLSGPIVPRLSEGFDSYWNSRWVYPVTALADFSLFPVDLDTVRQRITSNLDEREQLAPDRREEDFTDAVSRLRSAEPVEWADMVIDDPDVSWFQLPDEIAENLTEVALNTRREILVVTPYLVPTSKMLDIARTLTGRGVKVNVLTNSLSTTDVPLAHAMYSHFRPRIINMGVNLYEMRDDAGVVKADDTGEVSLHSKYIIFDDDLVFIGSLNLDRRSLYLNTELGVIVKSRPLAEKLRASFNDLIRPENAWRVTNTPDGLAWNSTAGTLEDEPAKGLWQRLRNFFFSLFPLHGQT